MKKINFKLMLVGIILIVIIPFAYSNGGCIKVVDNVLVQLSISPLVPVVNEQASFLISFANQEKALIEKEIMGNLSIIKNGETVLKKDFKIKGGVLDLKHTFTKPGLYELYVDFKIQDKTYNPEDFLIEVKDQKQSYETNIIFLIIGIAIGALLMKFKNKRK